MTTRAPILVVDDDPMMVRTLCDVLRFRGFAAEGVLSGEAALAAVDEKPWSAVLMDVRMTGITGVETARRLRRSHPQVPVILMSAYTEPETLLLAGEAGVERVLTKPVKPAALLAAVDLVLASPTCVLIVDEDPAFLQTLGDVLASQRIRTLRTRTVAAAVELLRDRTPRIVLLDLVLGDMTAAAAIAAMRAVSPLVEIMLYSGNEALLTEAVTSLPGDSCRAFLRKPTLLEELRKVLHGDAVE